MAWTSTNAAPIRAAGWRGGPLDQPGLSKRGMQALQMVGLLEQVLPTPSSCGAGSSTPDGSTRYRAYGKDDSEVLHSIDRNLLNHLLLDQAEQHPQVKLHFEHRLLRADKAQRELELETPGGRRITAHPAWVGVPTASFSSMRRELQHGMRADYQQECLEWATRS
jgi:kynurenine 3-monooxygenase